MYNNRIINIERASFTPLVFSTTGGMAPECEKLNKRLALIASERNQPCSEVLCFFGTKLRFSLLKSVLVAVRGYRGKSVAHDTCISDIDFKLIPSQELG